MKSFKKFYTVFEQAILLNLVIAYLISFMFVFNEQIRNTEWMGLIWISQFIILGILLVKRSKQKGWTWPSRP
jgi:hypothetical protein